VYSRYDYSLYRSTVGSYELIDNHPHSFGCVPVVEYLNNKEMLGDFEAEISLIDAYDTLISNSVNDSNDFSDAYLVLTGMSGTTAEDVAAMKTNRVLLMGDDSKAEWLIKNVNSSYQEDMKTRLDDEIHKFSGVPNLTDENFAQNASGVAIRYKLLGLENITSKKETSFRKGISRRLEIMCAYLTMLGNSANYLDIEIIFTRNIPANLAEIAQVLNQLGHLLSEETQLSLLPIDVDYEAEQERKKKEAELGYDDQFLLDRQSEEERSESIQNG
jgi:SPP1 family phage portal protein